MDRHRHHRRHHHHPHPRHQVSSFNLAGCMKPPQVKDTITRTTPLGTTTATSRPLRENHHRSHHLVTSTEPSSPKIGCMGQIKRKNKSSNSTTTTTTSSSSSSSLASSSASSSELRSRNKLFGLKRAFMERRASSRVSDDRSGASVVSVADLDPPLPVVRRRPVIDGNSISLWERRCGGEGLRGLQLEQQRLHLYCTAL